MQQKVQINTEIEPKASEIIELNNGKKWAVNKEMKPFIAKGEALVNDYLKKNLSDYHILAKEIKEQNDILIESCTMDGKSHEELHKWLHPHLELVENLEKETDANKAKDIILKLEKSYKEYSRYFQ